LVEDFFVQDTSTSANRGSVLVRFTLSKTIRLQAPRRYGRTFEGVFSIFPADEPKGTLCNCGAPSCIGPTLYLWQVCIAGGCQSAQTQLECP
jgi:hypothetical protein